MSDPIFGVVAKTVDDGLSPAIYADLDTVGIIGPAPFADPNVFPLNTPVIFNSDNYAMIASLALNVPEDTGFITDAIRGVDDQVTNYQQAAQVIVVRTAAGTDVDPVVALQHTIANIMGDSATGTGMFAFLLAPQLCHATPRLIMAPGYTGQLYNGLNTVVLTA